MDKLISILVPIYNVESSIKTCLLSLFNQTYKNIEYIIIDGGSTDGTIEIIKKYQNNLYYWVTEPDKGIYDAMNKGIRVASGDLIGIVNSDDYYEADALENISETYDGEKYEIVYGMLRTIKEGKEVSVYIKNHLSEMPILQN